MSVATDEMTPLQRAALTIRELKGKLESIRQASQEPIAIVGMDCRFPNAPDIDRFWALLRDGVDAIREVPPDRWDLAQWFDPNPNAAGKINTRHGGFVEDVAGFDAAFFGIPPREAMQMDPGQRLLLQVTWSALERAMIPPESLRGSRTGFFVGMSQNDYGSMQINGDPCAITAYSGTGNGGCFASGRIAFQYGFNGPVSTIDTACSSSLVALHQAVAALRNRECEVALAAGVQLNLTPPMQVFFARTQSMSPEGRCFTFDARANGLVLGEGVAVVVLRRLSDAQRDGQPILAVIRSTSVNHDGASGGLTVPNESAQEALVRDALQRARIDPNSVEYIETHGTATPLGDPIEVGALRAVFGKRPADQPLRIGSVKTNIGHLNASAAIASLLKTVLMLQHQQFVPHLHLQKPNPKIPWEGFAVQVPTVLQPWPAPSGAPRRAGVSSFGLSGTNGHLVLEEAPARAADTQSPPRERPLHLFALSARSLVALRTLAKRHVECLALANPEPSLADYCYSANAGRSHLPWRAVITCATLGELRAALAALAAGGDHPCLRESARSPGATGSTGSNRGAAPRVLLILSGNPIPRLPDHPSCRKWLTEYATDTAKHTPAAALAAYLVLASLWREWGIHPSAVQGVAGGRSAAAVLAGALTQEAAFAALAEGHTPALTSPQLTLLDGDGGRLTTLEGVGKPLTSMTGTGTGTGTGYDFALSLGTAVGETPAGTPWHWLLETLATLYLQGATVDWRGFDAGYARQWVNLPTYPFASDRYWRDNQATQPAQSAPTKAPLVAPVQETQETVVAQKETAAPLQTTEPTPTLRPAAAPVPAPTAPTTSTAHHTSEPWSLAQLMEQQLRLVAEAIGSVTMQQLAVLQSMTVAQRSSVTSAIPEAQLPVVIQTPVPPPEAPAPILVVETATEAPSETQTTPIETQAIPPREATQPEVIDPVRCGDWRLLLSQAADADALFAERERLAMQCTSDPDALLRASRDALRQTAPTGRRLMLSYQNDQDAEEILKQRDSKRVISANCPDQPPTVLFMFPGVGDHYLQMGRGLYRSEPLFRKIVDHCCDYLRPVVGVDLREVLYPPEQPASDTAKPAFDMRAMLGRAPAVANPQTERLNQTLHSQPLVFIIEYALARLWLARGVRPVAMIGYSIGEYNAAVLSGVMTLEDALRLIARRAELIESIAPGAMLAVPLTEQALQSRLGKDLSLAILSTPNQSVVAGPVAAIEALQEKLKAQELPCRRLQSSHAFHSKMLEPLHQPLLELTSAFRLQSPQIPYVSNVTGDWIRPSEATDPAYWARHTWHTVRFSDGMARLLASEAFAGSRNRLFLEVGPGVSLGSFMLQHPAAAQIQKKTNVASMRTMYERTPDEQFLINTLGKLYLAGIPFHTT